MNKLPTKFEGQSTDQNKQNHRKEMGQKLEVRVEEDATLRQWFSRYYPHISYNRLQQAIRNGDVKVNGKRENPQKQLSKWDSILFWKKLALENPQPEKARIHPSILARVKILEANDDFWVIDKPYGIASQGGTKVKISLIEILEQMMESEQ